MVSSQKDRTRFVVARQACAPSSTRERQEHLDAITAFAEAASVSGHRSRNDVIEADWLWLARREGESLAIFHQLAHDELQDGSLGPLARIKVDEKKCLGVTEWRAVREAAAPPLPKHTASAGWGGTDAQGQKRRTR